VPTCFLFNIQPFAYPETTCPSCFKITAKNQYSAATAALFPETACPIRSETSVLNRYSATGAAFLRFAKELLALYLRGSYIRLNHYERDYVPVNISDEG
jgi:hypothetical protein